MMIEKSLNFINSKFVVAVFLTWNNWNNQLYTEMLKNLIENIL